MKIKSIFTRQVSSLPEGKISLENDWTGSVETKILFTGPNGCGKSTLLRRVAGSMEQCQKKTDSDEG